MIFRFLKNILLIFPVIFLLAILVFFLSELAPGDKVVAHLELNGESLNEDEELQKQDYIEVAKSLNLDLPPFYFSIHPIAYPNTIYKLKTEPAGELKKALFVKYLSIDKVNRLFDYLNDFNANLRNSKDTILDKNYIKELLHISLNLKNSSNPEEFNDNYKIFYNKFSTPERELPSKIVSKFKKIDISFNKLKSNKVTTLSIFPKITFYGSNNRFHKWFGKILLFDFGNSIIDGQKASTKILKSLKWTLLYILIAYILTFGIAIPLGIYTAANSNKKISTTLNTLFVAFHSLPLFWLATLSVILFTTSGLFHIFPSIGIGKIDSDMSTLRQFIIATPHLLLPSIIIAIHSGAYLGTLIRRNMQVEMKKKYFLALLARGIPKKQVILKHIFPNSLLPLITLLVVSFPASLAGSVITEVIFNIPGMGRLLYDSILNYDWNIVFAIVLIIGFVTYLSYMIGDFLYSYFNPQIKYTKTND